MGRAWRKWSGLVLTLVWMTARLVLPLQPHCPHHPATAAATVATAASDAHEGVHAHHVEAAHPTPADDHSTPASACDCAAACCAATVETVPSSALSVGDALSVSVGRPVPPDRRTARFDTRATYRHPPATAPPAFSAIA